MKITKKFYNKVRNILTEATDGCTIQHRGFPCGTCFFAIDKRLTNQHWQTILWFRGDHRVKDLNNLPKPGDRKKYIDEVLEYCKGKKINIKRVGALFG